MRRLTIRRHNGRREQPPSSGEPAAAVHRGRAADAGGAQLLAAGRSVHPFPAGRMGRSSLRLGGARRVRWTIPRFSGERCSDARPPCSWRSAQGWGRRPRCWRRSGRRTTSWRWRCGGRGWHTPWGSWPRRGQRTSGCCRVDAVWCLENLFEPGEVEEVWTFFPDPWPKQRHHKRRLVTPEFAALAASRLRPGWESGGSPPTGWSTPTRCGKVLDAQPRTGRWTGGALGRPPGDEVRAEGAGSRGLTITDLAYRRT